MHFVTISRKLGSYGSEITRIAAQNLGYKIIDTEAIDAMAKKMGFLESVESVDEKVRLPYFCDFFTQKPHVQLDRLNSVIYELADQGDTIFLGRGGHILLKSFDVRLACANHRVLGKACHQPQERGYSRKTPRYTPLKRAITNEAAS